MVSGDFSEDGLDQDDVDANDQWWGCSLGTGGAGTALTGWWECPHISYIELHRNIARVYFQKYFIFPWSVFVVYAISNCVATEPGSVSFSYTILTWTAWWLQSIEKKKTTVFSSCFYHIPCIFWLLFSFSSLSAVSLSECKNAQFILKVYMAS